MRRFLKMEEKERQDIALFRYGILSPAISGTMNEDQSMRSFFKEASLQKYRHPNGKLVSVSAPTLSRWYQTYKKQGLEGLYPQRRVDMGNSRKLDDDMKAQIRYLKQEYPRLPATLIYQKLFENGTIKYKEVSLSTVTRYINQLKRDAKQTNNKDMRRYEHKYINVVWQGDSSYGIYLTIDGKKQRTYIICLLDDASRFLVGIDIFLNDNFTNLMSVMKSAVMRFGVPKLFNFDNGSNYKCKQMDLLTARIGSTVHYCRPYSPNEKGKVERVFHTIKTQWMSGIRATDYKSLDELRKSLFAYVDSYNKKPHSSLDGKTPEDRFFEDSSRIKRLSDEKIEQSFLLEYERRVAADGVITIEGIEYEVHYRYAKQKIRLRYAPDLSQVFIVNPLTLELEEIKRLNKHDNAKIKREKIRLAGGDE